MLIIPACLAIFATRATYTPWAFRLRMKLEIKHQFPAHGALVSSPKLQESPHKESTIPLPDVLHVLMFYRHEVPSHRAVPFPSPNQRTIE